jgi:hypothetical protein
MLVYTDKDTETPLVRAISIHPQTPPPLCSILCGIVYPLVSVFLLLVFICDLIVCGLG